MHVFQKKNVLIYILCVYLYKHNINIQSTHIYYVNKNVFFLDAINHLTTLIFINLNDFCKYKNQNPLY